jgi:LPXTG-motif cell wall-anchored protein
MTVIPPPSPIPGFPLESILAGLVAGAAALLVLRRRRRT